MVNSYIQGNVVVGMEEMSSIANYVDLHLQSIRKLYITVEVIDRNDKTIETIQGLSTGGSIDTSGESLIRRTGSLSFVLMDTLMPSRESILWMTNKVRIYAGIEDNSSSEKTITHFCLGTFFITEPSVSISSESREISITLEDYMMKWEQEEIDTKLKIESGTPLHTAVEKLINSFGEFNTKVEFTDLKIPYTLEFDEGTSVMDILTDLRDLYMDWECHYDVGGKFVFRKVKIQREDDEPTSWSFDKEANLIKTFGEGFTYKDVKNKVVVIGGIDDRTGLTPRAESEITLEDSPFHKSEIGERKKVIVEGSYSNKIQCDSRARYDLFKMSTFQEKADITSLPIYYLDANDVIEVRNPATNNLDKYVIDSMSTGLGIEDDMSIACHKVYFNHFDMSSDLGDYRKSAEIIIDGIKNKGWLSLAEDRIHEFYGIKGSGSKLIIRFEYDALYGTTAYTTGYIGSDIQSITIDLADFENSKGDSGDNGAGKAEYSDRVLAHEMVHVVMNSYFGVAKAIQFPTWFKEGMGEFIHGADERLKKSIVKNKEINTDLANSLISRAVDLLNHKSWKGDSDDYSAGYLIVKYIDKNIIPGKTMKDLLHEIKSSEANGSKSLSDSLVNLTSSDDYGSLVSKFKSGARSFISTSVSLDLNADEVDTGSIGGSDHRGGSHLNAEDVFNNENAKKNTSSLNYAVEFRSP